MRLRRRLALWLDPSLGKEALLDNLSQVHWRLSMIASLLPVDGIAALNIAGMAIGRPKQERS